MQRLRLIILLSLGLSHCQEAPEGADERRNTITSNSNANAVENSGQPSSSQDKSAATTPGTQQSNTTPASPQPGTPAVNEGTVSNTNPSTTTPTNPTSTKPATGTTFNSEAYFDEVIFPLFNDSCDACHVGPRVVVNPRGPLTIFNHENTVKWLLDGTNSWDNALIKKMVNITAHSGGDRCGASYSNSPCKEVRDWFIAIKGADKEPAPTTITAGGLTGFGATASTNWDGQIYGYAYDPAVLTTAVSVEFYKDNAFDQGGVALGSAMANLTGFDGGATGDHRFQFKIPAANITSGTSMKVYMYAIVGGQKKALSDSPVTLTAYIPKAETFFTNNVSPTFNCGPCHAARTYTGAYTQLISPPKHQGGTRTNNSLYLYASGQKNGHPNQCGGGGPCTQISNWWDQEFGP